MVGAASVKITRLIPVAAFVAAFVLAWSTALAADGALPTGDAADVVSAAAPGGLLEVAIFYIVAAATVFSALGVCVSRTVVRMAIWLFCALGGVAMLYFLLAATFIGAIQLIVYSGGTLILLVFGVMLTSKSPWARLETSWVELGAAAVVCLGLLATLCMVYLRTSWPVVAQTTEGTSVYAIGVALMTKYLVPFEVAGVLLFVVMVGAAQLARQEKK
jgi:NADH:ubiquinone oxidoreductase subunit 6 (subunit J)